MAETKEDFVTSLLALPETDSVVEHFRLIFEPIFSGMIIDKASQHSGSSQKESAAKDEKIPTLQRQVTELMIKMNDHEQHGRRDSVWIYGLSKASSGTTD